MTKRGVLRFLSFVLATLVIASLLLALLVMQPVPSAWDGKQIRLADAERLRRDVAFLAEGPNRRSYPRLADLNQAADYIRREFHSAGARVEEQIYDVDGQRYRNVVGSFGPVQGERIIVGAHYDSWGGMPGADDNASGTAGLLELARLLGKQQPNSRVDLVAYTLEEPPFFRSRDMGSFRHARMLQQTGIQVRGMICLEMIGYFSDEAASQHYPVGAMQLLYPARADFIAVVGGITDVALLRRVKKAMIAANDLSVRSINAPAAVPGVDFSDHWSYWQHDYPAVMISDTAFYRNDRYHTPRDTPDTLDFQRMASVVDKVLSAVLDLAR